MKMPGCCGREMSVRSVTGKFTEVYCGVCDDVAYIKTHVKGRK